MECKICNKDMKNSRSISAHVKYHNLTLIDYYVKYENFNIPLCECGKECKVYCGISYYKTCGDKECISKINKSHTHSEETKKIISEKRKKYLRENPDKHPWKRRDKFISPPCENIKKILKNENINYEEEVSVSTERFFSIDILLPEKNLIIEINGNQHYGNNGSLKDYYQERHDFLIKLGFSVLEIPSKFAFNKKYILDLIKNHSDDDKIIKFWKKEKSEKKEKRQKIFKFKRLKLKEKKKYYCSCGKEKTKTSKQCIDCKRISERKVKNRPSYEQLLKDLDETNWTQTGKKYGVSDNAVRKWVKKYKVNKKCISRLIGD